MFLQSAKRQKNRRFWKLSLWVTVVVTTFLTTYFLILPAITVETSQIDQAAIKIEETKSTEISTWSLQSDASTNTTESETTPSVNLEPTSMPSYLEGYLTYSGPDYTVKIGISKDAQLSEETFLKVQEITESDEGYNHYKTQALDKIEKSEEEVRNVKFYDIKLYDGEQEVQPEAPVTVQVSYNYPFEVKREDLEIVHFKESGELEILESTDTDEAKDVEGEIAFQTSSFSVYAIVQNGEEIPRLTYHFENADGSRYDFVTSSGQTTDVQILKNNESLSGVGIPKVSGNQHFNGWFVYDKTTDTYKEEVIFDKPISVTQTKDIYVRPNYGTVAYVSFYDDAAGTTILERSQVILENGSTTIDLTQYTVEAPIATQVFAGWTKIKNGQTVIPESQAKNYPITEDLNLYPVFKNARRLEFNTGDINSGATYISPQWVIEGNTAQSVRPENPSRKGYTFAGWYTAETGGSQFDFSSVIMQDTILYARWTPSQSEYTVVYWKQSVTDKKNATVAQKTYDYAGQETRTGTTNATVSITTMDRRPDTGFFYTTDKGQTSATVNADGSTVINVYFNRQLITMQFTSYNLGFLGYEDYWNSRSYATTFTGLYGSTLASNGYSWPTSSAWRYFNSSNGMTGMSYLGEFILPDSVRNHANYANGTLIRMVPAANKTNEYRFYKQNLDGSYSVQATDIGAGAGSTSFTFSEKYAGFTVSQARRTYANGTAIEPWQIVAVGNSRATSYTYLGENYYYDLEIRYERKSFEINFLDPFTDQRLANIPSPSVKYEENISKYKPSSEITPVSSRPGYRFTGKWYKDAAMTEEIDWNTMMPSHALKVYAGFEKNRFNVTIDPDGGQLDDTMATYFKVDYGETITKYDISRDYVEDPEGEYYYRYDTVSGDTTDKTGRHAHYTKNPDEPNVDKTRRYRYEKDAYRLIGWYVVNHDATIRPYNFSEAVTQDITLRAVWRRVGEYHVKYSNEAYDMDGKPLRTPDGAPVYTSDAPTDGNSYDDGSHSALMSRPTIPAGYRFRGWYYDGKRYNPYDSITILSKLADSNKNINIHPILIPIEEIPLGDTFLIYDGNGGSRVENSQTVTSVKLDHLDVNTTLQAESVGYFTRVGYELIGWNDDKEAASSGVVKFKPGQEIGVDNAIPVGNTLYAVWTPKLYTVTVTKSVIGLESDKEMNFTFDPTDNLQRENFSLKNGETKTFFQVPYGTEIGITEQDYKDFATEETITEKNLASGEATKTYVANQLESLTVVGDVDIVFTNTRRHQTISIQKVSMDNMNQPLSGAEFSIYAKGADGEKTELPLYTEIQSITCLVC